MINPSTPGWIEKFFAGQRPLKLPVINDDVSFYKAVRNTGFIYGHIVSFDTQKAITAKNKTPEEISKIALLSILYNVFARITAETKHEKFIASAVAFYKEMSPEGFNPLKKVLPDNSLTGELEKILGDRVQTNDNIISKSFSHILTNALLFEDILAFRQYLVNDEIPLNYLKKLEETIVSVVSLALNAKQNKSNYDDLLVKLFESSVRYTKFSKVQLQNPETLELDYFTYAPEKYYIIDMAGLAMWSDSIIENSEKQFLLSLASIMNVSPEFVSESILQTDQFIKKNKAQIPYFNYSNPVKHFYDHTTQYVMMLISRNKKRLLKELSNNGELMLLLSHSTHRSLDGKEKKKVKKQLLEICKTVPSLTIFLLPGGSLLLPLLVKFIPKMLPSAFNENLEE
ncbi:LETM1-related biofilm-associated protein [Flavobacterium sp.]|uniref:LETM1-related biofilm-associated protein n=1 Tax=Flavobacterium sp. TaxID=239 RepID=UPI00261C1168|nr:LETM1-related biofilm-associated protein [Flavobacterium sp.]